MLFRSQVTSAPGFHAGQLAFRETSYWGEDEPVKRAMSSMRSEACGGDGELLGGRQARVGQERRTIIAKGQTMSKYIVTCGTTKPFGSLGVVGAMVAFAERCVGSAEARVAAGCWASGRAGGRC